MPTYVQYMVPVLVEVDTVRAEVVRVQVDDERAEGPSDVFSTDQRGFSASDARRAATISEAQVWPAWELGA